MTKKTSSFPGIYYSKAHRSSLKELIVPTWNADELWGDKDSEISFRNALVGTSDECSDVWRAWRDADVFDEETEPCIYVLEHKFTFQGKSFRRFGAFAACNIEESTFLTHELVSKEGAENARERYAACEADLTPLFAGVSEVLSKEYRELLLSVIDDGESILRCDEGRGATHEVWKVAKRSSIERVTSFLDEHQLYLLDGHHRWKAALMNKGMGKGDGRIVACITSLSKDDTLILPIHRALVKESWLLPQNSINDLEAAGCKVKKQLKWKPDVVEEFIFKMLPEERVFYFLPVQSAELYVMELPEPASRELVVDEFELMTRAIANLHLAPVFSLSLLVEELASGQAQAAAFLPPMLPNQIRKVADSGGSLPRKSTRFYPKPAIGLISRAWRV